MGDTNAGSVAAATAGTDSTPVSGTVTFAAGAATATFTVAVNTDTITEGLEGLKISLFDGTTVVGTKTVLLNDDPNAVPTGQLFTLTIGVDNLVGTSSNDTIIGVIGTGATLNAGDAVNGGAGIDTLRISSGSATALATGLSGVTVTSIETISMINPGNVDLDASSLTGVTTLRVEDATGLGGKTITASAGLINLSLTTTGGAAAGGLVTFAGNAADATLNLTLAGYQGSANPPSALTVSGTGTTTLNIASTTAANKVSTLTGPATVTTINIAATTALTNTATTAVAVTKLTITGAGAVALGTTNFAGTVTVDASAATGNISMVAEAPSVLTFIGGTGNDTLTFGTAGDLTAADSVNLGTGNNTLSLADTALGGSGTAAFNAVVNAITSAQTILVTADGTTVDMSGVTARILSLGAASNFTVTKIEAADKIVVNGVTAGTLSAIAPLGFNTLNLELNGTAAAVAAVGASDFTQQATVNILSTGAATSAGPNLIGAVTNTTNATFTITGANALEITSLSAAAAVNGSAMTGALTITGANAASSFTGGSRADVLTGATAAGGDVFVGGAGNDTINTAAVTGTVATVITGGTGADIINLKAVGSNVGKLVTLNATAAESFATAASFDVVTFSDQAPSGTNIVTLVTGLLSSVLVGAATVTIGTTTITAGGFLAVGTMNATLTTTNQNFSIFQDSNSNGIIDATDLRVDFTDVAAADTMAITLVGSQIVVTSTGVA